MEKLEEGGGGWSGLAERRVGWICILIQCLSILIQSLSNAGKPFSIAELGVAKEYAITDPNYVRFLQIKLHTSHSCLLSVCAGYMSNSRSLAASFLSLAFFFFPSSLLSHSLILLFCFKFCYLFWLFLVFIVHVLLMALSGLSCGMLDFSSLTSDLSQVPCMGTWSPIHCTTRDVPHITFLVFSSVVQSQSCLTLPPQGLQHARLPCLSPAPGACSHECPLSRWCHPTISSSVIPFSSCLQSFPESWSFPMSTLPLTHSVQFSKFCTCHYFLRHGVFLGKWNGKITFFS